MLKNRWWGGGNGGTRASDLNASTYLSAHGQFTEALQLMKCFEESGSGWFWSTDEFGNLIYISDSVSPWIGTPSETLIGSRFADIFIPADGDPTGRRSLSFLLSKTGPFEKVLLRCTQGDRLRFWSVSGAPRFDPSGQLAGYRGSAIDVTEHRQSTERASILARYDALTGLPNRRRMVEMLECSLNSAQQRDTSCAVLMIDLDRFKQVNDTLGHPAGDELLKQVAERLVKIVGDREKVFRLGGDEFKIILQNHDNRGIIGDLANDIIASLSQPYSIEGSRCVIGASIGIAIAPVDGTTKDDLIRNADLALYGAKSSGRGRFRFFATELLKVAEDKRMLEEDLRDALSRNEFALSYQPIVCAVTNIMTGVEALIRWNHPTRGPVSPSLFIPIAEETGLIEEIGGWVLRQACQDAAGWPGKLRVAVNVSPIQFTNEAFPELIQAALDDSGLAPERLELEITEGVFLGEGSATDTMFARLKEIGVRLALDDFGTGYSSLGYLRSAPFDKIKIDQSFVHAATLANSRNSAIIAAIVALAGALEMETTAEGIEFMDQLQLVRDLRVSHVQGWIYSKAIPSEELAEKIAGGSWRIEPVGPAKQRSPRQTMYRKIGLIHGSRYREVIVRNLSDSGALLDGIENIEVGALVVLDFGDGQLVFARVTRIQNKQAGIAFAQPLVDDGNGGLCTSHRVSPHLLKTAGLPSSDQPEGEAEQTSNVMPMEELAKKLGLTLAPEPSEIEGPIAGRHSSRLAGDSTTSLTVRDLADRYLEAVGDDQQEREAAWRDLRNHVLPRFGQLRLDQVSQPDVTAWLAAKNEVERQPAGTDSRLHGLLSKMWTLAANLDFPGATPNPLEGEWVARRSESSGAFTVKELRRLFEAMRGSHNRQLRFIIPLLMLTGARTGELLRAKWEQFDLEGGTWGIPDPQGEGKRVLHLAPAAVTLISELPKWPDCPYLLPNPATRKPYRSIHRSWDVVRSNAGLPFVELHDLRFCDIGKTIPDSEIVALVRQDGSYAQDQGSEFVTSANAPGSLAA